MILLLFIVLLICFLEAFIIIESLQGVKRLRAPEVRSQEDFLEYEFCKVFTLAPLKEGKGEDRSWKRNARCKKQWARHFK